MFRRLFWFFTGAATGVWATTKVNRAVRRLSPDSLAVTAADRALTAGARLRLFARDVRAGMAQREDELGDALGLSARAQAPALPHSRKPAPPAVLPAQDTDLPAARRGSTPYAPYTPYDRKDEN